MIIVNETWDFVLGLTASESRPWITLNTDAARIESGRLIIRSGFSLSPNEDGDVYRAINSTAAGRRPYLGSYKLTFDLIPLAAGSLRYRDIVSGSSVLNIQVSGGPVAGSVLIFGPGVNVSIPPPASPLVIDVFWNDSTKQMAVRVTYPGGVSDTGFFAHAAGGVYGLPQFDWTAADAVIRDCFSIGAFTGFHDLTDVEVDAFYSSPANSRPSILTDSTGKISHARIIRGHRSPAQAQAFHDAMRGAL